MTEFKVRPGEEPHEAAQRQLRASLMAGLLRLALLPAHAFILMLAVGALHGLTATVPAIGYGTMLLLMVGLDYIAGTIRRRRK
ncbi:hypothetical protein CP967_31205 [Streptomyces nitrosporeus]|uniref:Uncharacterized protein n=1 Tax=Streptomyces nitrosporeus TaxID=28894 RepID=A0A5J6FLV1_9ACTN|nr:hypothetical protein [Streptomyces nitrosporeus]QEU75840.1 hypothetical protein CP967_31205 [Streptomyces nitrosporeus]GGY88691.1 hypothetical protein GCM10010327_19270 [Streptomyces nitrosporeus]